MLNNNGYGQKCDVWMMGMLLYEMFHDKTPFNATVTEELFSQILTVSVRNFLFPMSK